MSVKITDLGPVVLPLTGTEQLEVIQLIAGVEQSRRVSTMELATVAAPAAMGTFTDPDAPDLVDTLVALRVGAVDPDTAPHIEVGPQQIQAKLTLNTVAVLTLNALGGNVIVGSTGGAAGFVHLAASGVSRVVTAANSAQLRSDGVADPTVPDLITLTLDLRSSDQNLYAQFGYDGASAALNVDNEAWNGGIQLRARDGAGVRQALFAGLPAGLTQLYFAGAGVMRTEAAASGGLLVNNLQTGAGFERVLTTSDAGGGVPGGVDTNIQFNNAGAFDGDTQFTYSTVTGEVVITHDQAPGASRPALLITTNIAAPGTRFNTNQSSYSLAEINSNSVANTGFDLDLDFTGADAQHFLRLTDQAGSFLQTWQRDGIVNISNNQLVVDPTGNAAIRVEATTLIEMNERAAANPLTAGIGQYWVRDDVPNVPIFTDDAGTDFVLNAAGSIPDPLIIGSVNATSNAAINSSDNIAALNIGNTAIPGTLPIMQINSQFIQSKSSKFSSGATIFINNLGGDIQLGNANFASITINAPASGVQVKHSTAAVAFQTDVAGMRVNLGSVYMDEKAAAATDFAARGQFWVRNDVPNVPMFTNDVGTDFVLNAGGSQTPWLSAIDADGFDLNDGGVIFLREQAAAEADVAGQGQIWVNSVPNPNELMYTDESGNDINLITDLWNNGTRQVVTTALGIEVRDTLHVGVGGASGVIKLGEQASADADEAGYGQIWVETDTPNRLKFTDDSGQDFDVAVVGGFAGDNVFLNVSRNFNTAGNFAANNILYYADGGNNTITTEDSTSVVNWPVHTSIQIIAPGSGVQTIAEGTGTTIFDDTGTDLVGGYTLSQGVNTIYRASTTDYIAWGSGMTP